MNTKSQATPPVLRNTNINAIQCILHGVGAFSALSNAKSALGSRQLNCHYPHLARAWEKASFLTVALVFVWFLWESGYFTEVPSAHAQEWPTAFPWGLPGHQCSHLTHERKWSKLSSGLPLSASRGKLCIFKELTVGHIPLQRFGYCSLSQFDYNLAFIQFWSRQQWVKAHVP